MNKRLLCIICVFILLFVSVVSASASASDEENLNCLYDYEDILTDEEEEELEDLLSEISEDQEFAVAIVTSEDFDGYYAEDYADDFYGYNNLGYGDENDGILLAISDSEGEAHITTTGYGLTAFTDAGQDYIISQISNDLSDGEYYDAFTNFAQLCDDFVSQAKDGEPYDSGNLPRGPYSMVYLLISIAIGIVIAFIVVSVMKGQLKTVVRKTNAHDYMRAGSLQINDSRDIFLYRNVIRKHKPKSNGSSTHVDSSGTSHGGKSFKF